MTGDTPAVVGASSVGRALARVLSAVAQEERKENSLESLSCPLESVQLPDSPQQSSHTTVMPTGKIHHCFLTVEL